MKRIICMLAAIFLLGSCAKDSAEQNSEKNPATKSGKPAMTITIRFLGSSVGSTLSQAWAEQRLADGGYIGSFGIRFMLRNVVYRDDMGADHVMDTDVEMFNLQPSDYSGTLPVIRTEETYVDAACFETVPASVAEQYDITWNVEVIPVKTTPLPPVSRGNGITVEWNGSTWEIVAQKAVTSKLTVTCDGPGTPPTEWEMPVGSTRVDTGSSDSNFAIISVYPESDDTYDYSPVN